MLTITAVVSAKMINRRKLVQSVNHHLLRAGGSMISPNNGQVMRKFRQGPPMMSKRCSWSARNNRKTHADRQRILGTFI
jgi:hypothetical protein